jgi:NAD+ diphosphatase
MAASVYTYCPRCAAVLEPKAMGNSVRPVCASCGFIQFHDPKVAVIALITCDDHVVLTQRAVNPQKDKWTLPGGYMDAGEMPEEALQRELIEEIGLPVIVNGLIQIMPMLAEDAAGQYVNRGIVLAYSASPRSGKLDILQSKDDVQAAQWFTQQNIPPNLAFESTYELLARWGVQLSSAPSGLA